MYGRGTGDAMKFANDRGSPEKKKKEGASQFSEGVPMHVFNGIALNCKNVFSLKILSGILYKTRTFGRGSWFYIFISL